MATVATHPISGEDIKPRADARSHSIPAMPNEGQYVVFDSAHQVVASDDNVSSALQKALALGRGKSDLTISFNNKTNAICLW